MTGATAHPQAAGRFSDMTADDKAGVRDRRTAKSVDDLLTEASAVLPLRPPPVEAFAAQAKGCLLIDIRGDDQRRAGGLIPDAVILPGNSLEWRCDPVSRWRHPA